MSVLNRMADRSDVVLVIGVISVLRGNNTVNPYFSFIFYVEEIFVFSKMPPHSEIDNNTFPEFQLRPKIKRKRSRSNSVKHFQFNETEINNNINQEKQVDLIQVQLKNIVSFKEAPLFLQFNPYILNGYRTNLNNWLCIKSLFWWTNETLNAWTHLLGWFYFAYFTVRELVSGFNNEGNSSWQDSVIMIIILTCFQICMAMSAGYHVFCCHSEDSYHCWLSYDLCGISFSLLAIYTSGIYYAFWCQTALRTTYIVLIGLMFMGAVIFQTTPKFLGDDYAQLRLIFFVSWSAFGVFPCLHWVYQNGGFLTPNVFDLVSRIGIMYLICALALFFYVTKIPERWFPGCVDYIGSSHQWWHIIIFLAFLHWQNTGIYYAEFRSLHGCFEYNNLTVW